MRMIHLSFYLHMYCNIELSIRIVYIHTKYFSIRDFFVLPVNDFAKTSKNARKS
jgi:hypothetical protein